MTERKAQPHPSSLLPDLRPALRTDLGALYKGDCVEWLRAPLPIPRFLPDSGSIVEISGSGGPYDAAAGVTQFVESLRVFP
jgi:hypothetical protein